MTDAVSIVVPAFNEGAAIRQTLEELGRLAATLGRPLEVVVVNDGSRDDTLQQARAVSPSNFDLVVVDLSRNFGKEAALSAGLAVATGSAVIPIDADLQDPPELIPEMIRLWEEGHDVVLARRADRSADGFMKRFTAAQFYRLMNRVSDVPLPENVGDFRLMDRAVVDVIRALPENRRFMKGLFAWAGFRTTTLDYARPARVAGETKFKALRLVNLAIEGLTSFSTAPLRVATGIGALVALLAFAYGSWIVLRTLIFGVDLPGYASLMSVLLFMSGLQLMALGLIGEYVGRTYIESKRRPAYVIRSTYRIEGPVRSLSEARRADAPKGQG